MSSLNFDMSKFTNRLMWLLFGVLVLSGAGLWAIRGQILLSDDENLAPRQLMSYAALSNVTHLKQTVRRLCVKRVIGTESHRLVREFIVKKLEKNLFTVEIDSFSENTPRLGMIKFHNIIATLNPKAERYLLLSCHYDSKYFPDFEFVAATDSAVPCAMLLNMAKLFKDVLGYLKKSKHSLMLVFFDGEEATNEGWSTPDSLYGARHLAKKWESEKLLKRINLFVLLDLIGASDVQFKNYIEETSSWFMKLVTLQKRLKNHNLLPHKRKYVENIKANDPEDDHKPFKDLKVPVLHLIASPFPKVWHKRTDTEKNIDYVATEHVGMLLRLFVLDYFFKL